MKQRASFRTWKCEDVNTLYEWCKDVNQGTYGEVYKAKDKSTDKTVALKRIKKDVEHDGYPITALREISILQSIQHPNILEIKNIVTTSQDQKKDKISSTYLVFDYFEHDFECLIRNKISFNLSQIKNILYQLLEGLAHLHDQNILHRDIKSANILYKNDGTIVIADFGLAKKMNQKFTNKVVTLWYRAPELILGAKSYDARIDMWSVGCFLYELLTKEIFFKGQNEKDQLEKISKICGTDFGPNTQTYKYFDHIKPEQEYPNILRNHLYQKIILQEKHESTSILNLLEKMLCLDPEERLTARDALNHSFFQEQPKICLKQDMPFIEQKDLHGRSKLQITEKESTVVNTNSQITKTISKSNKYAQHLIKKTQMGLDPKTFGSLK